MNCSVSDMCLAWSPSSSGNGRSIDGLPLGCHGFQPAFCYPGGLVSRVDQLGPLILDLKKHGFSAQLVGFPNCYGKPNLSIHLLKKQAEHIINIVRTLEGFTSKSWVGWLPPSDQWPDSHTWQGNKRYPQAWCPCHTKVPEAKKRSGSGCKQHSATRIELFNKRCSKLQFHHDWWSPQLPT